MTVTHSISFQGCCIFCCIHINYNRNSSSLIFFIFVIYIFFMVMLIILNNRFKPLFLLALAIADSWLITIEAEPFSNCILFSSSFPSLPHCQTFISYNITFIWSRLKTKSWCPVTKTKASLLSLWINSKAWKENKTKPFALSWLCTNFSLQRQIVY